MINLLFLFVAFLGYYFFRLDAFGIQYLPSFFTLISSTYFLFKYYRIIPLQKFILFFMGILFLNIISYGSFQYDLLIEKFSKSIFLLFNIFCSYLFFIHINSFSKSIIKKWIFGFLIIISVGVTLQYFIVPFDNLVQSFVNKYYRADLGLFNLTDIAFFGSARPTFFSSEASHIAAKIFVLACLLSRLYQNQKIDLILFFSVFLLSFIIKSPVLVLPLIYILVKNFKFNLVYLLFGIIISIIFIWAFSNLYDARLFQFALGTDNSFNRRFLIPYYNAMHVIFNYPFGLGFTSGELINEHIYDINNKLGLSIDPRTMRSWNSFFEFFITFGIIGCSLIACLIYYFIKLKKIALNFFDILFIFLLSNFFGILNIFLWQSIFLYFVKHNE